MARIKAFDPDDALQRAMELFWQSGYASTSLSALLEHMGISRQSLYDTFGDKNSLYLAALDRYEVAFTELIDRHLGNADAGVPALVAFAQVYVSNLVLPRERGGCMMAAAALELGLHDDGVAARAQAHIDTLEFALKSAIAEAQRRGEVDTSHDPTAAARVLVAVLSGLGVMVRSGATRTALRRTIEGAINALVPPLPS